MFVPVAAAAINGECEESPREALIRRLYWTGLRTSLSNERCVRVRWYEHMSEMIKSEVVPIFGLSDGGAHTKFFTGGRYATETLVKLARDNPVISLEEAHWRLSAHPAMCAGFRNCGTLWSRARRPTLWCTTSKGSK
jgi:N-acyl-D-aspartate/D-glutamate deacylase